MTLITVRQSAILLCFVTLLSACTWRYSRQMVAVGPALGERVTVRSRGIELLFIAVLEPKAASVLIEGLNEKNNCAALHNIEIDYRNRIFVLFNLPAVTVSADCEPHPPAPEAPAAPPAAAPSSPPAPSPPPQDLTAPPPAAPTPPPVPSEPFPKPSEPPSPTPELGSPQGESGK